MSRRTPVLVLIAALLVSSWFTFDATTQTGTSDAAVAVVDPSQLSPVVPAASARSSTWFCPMGTAMADSGADHTVVVTNPTDRPVAGRLEVFTFDTGPRRPQPAGEYTFEVAAGGRVSARLGDVVSGEWAAALVDVAGGGVVVDQELRGPAGADVARCASRASADWYFPWGQSSIGSSLRLALFNPFPGDAVVDLTFVTDDGFRSPEDFEALLVPAHQLLIVDVGAVVTRRAQIATTVHARTGQVVAEQLQTTTTSSGTVSLAATMGARTLAHTLYFAGGRADGTTVERFVVFNPSERTLDAELTVLNEVGDAASRVEPFQLRVGPSGYAEVVLNREPRVPLPISHAVVIQALGEVPMAAARVLQSGEQAPPQPQREGAPANTDDAAARVAAGLALPTGLAVTMGSAVTAKRWVASSVVPQSGGAGRIIVYNPSSEQPVTVGFAVFGLAPIGDVVVAPGRQKEIVVSAVPGNAGLPGGAVQVTGSGPIVVERWVAIVNPVDIGAELAVPTIETATVADPFS